MQPIVAIHNLRHVYNPGSDREVAALRGVNLTVDRGDIVAIIGANGSGKSTLVRHLNGLLLPTEGSVTVDGLDTRDPQNRWLVRQAVGMVFQNPDNQMVGTTVEEDVAFGPENLGLPPEEILARIDDALAVVDMAAHRYRSPHQLSGGQKQRVAIAGILAMRSKVMVLDEPTAMLDPQGRAEVLAALLRVNGEEGITVIFSTHFMEEAAVAHRVVLMEEGRIALEGPPAQVLTDTERLAAAGVEPPPVNRLVQGLRRRGLPLPAHLLTVDELVDALCRLSSKT